jgi:tetratricopeptide (TPR) repeat protein
MSANVGGWMTRIGVTTVVVLIAVMVLQAIALLGRKKAETYHFWSGILTILLAVKLALGAGLFGTASLITIPSLGILVVQGSAHIFLRLLLLAIAVASGVFVQSARCARGRRERWPVLVLLGVLVGVFAAFRVRPLNPADDTPLRLYGYDLWSPTLLCWICICALEWTLVILCLSGRWFRGWMEAVLIAGITLAARSHPAYLYFDSWTPILWTILLWSGWAATFFFGLRNALLTWFPKAFKDRRWARVVLAAFSFSVSLGSLYLLRWVVVDPSSKRALLATFVTFALVVVSIIPFVIHRPDRRRSFMEPLYGLGGRSLDLALLATLLLLLAFSSDVFYFRRLAIGCDLSGLALSAVLLIEITSEGPLQGAGNLASAIWGNGSSVRKALAYVYGRVRGLIASALAPLKPLATRGGVSATLGKIATVILVLIVVEEIPCCGKTLIYPLNAHSLPAAEAPLGEAVADRMANRITELMSKLRPDMLVYVGRNFSMTSVADPSVTKVSLQEDWLEVGPARVPMSTLVSLLKTPLQSLFGARIVSGTIQKHDSGYDLLLGTSTGDAWREASNPDQRSPSACVPAEGVKAGAAVPAEAALEGLFKNADALAYKVVSSDPAWSRAGMTTDPSAFSAFYDGMFEWNRYQQAAEHEKRIDELQRAIAGYRTAIQIDPKFSVANYRLGLALREDAQPGTAIQAFEAAIESNPRFGTALVALAATLFDHDSYLPSRSVSADVSEQQEEATKQRRAKAHAIWQRVIVARDLLTSATDRGSAFLGLCRSSLLSGDAGSPNEGERALQTTFRNRTRSYIQAYYYCARADAIYSRLASDAASAPEIRATRASIYNEMAVALISAGNGLAGPSLERTDGCSGTYADLATSTRKAPVTWKRPPSLFDGAALDLLNEAHALGPDNLRIACNWAWTRAAQGEPSALQRVRSPELHMQVGDDFLALGREQEDARWVSRALDQYQAALQLDPMRLAAMNDYADAFWTGRVLYPNDLGILNEFASAAEKHARQAVRLGRDRVSSTSMVDYVATLGEVLLALGRPHEAIKVLLGETKPAPSHSFYDESRWALAQAYACAIRQDERDTSPHAPGCTGLVEKATHLYRTIRGDEENRESLVYSGASYFDSRFTAKLCPDSQVIPRASEVTYESAGCEQSLVLEASSDLPETAVHVWGRGVDALLDPHSGWRALIGNEPVDTHRQYFVQLVSTADQTSVSQKYWLQTFSSPKTNLIRIAFRGGHLAPVSNVSRPLARRPAAVSLETGSSLVESTQRYSLAEADRINRRIVGSKPPVRVTHASNE